MVYDILDLKTCNTNNFVELCTEANLIPIATRSYEILIYLAPENELLILNTLDHSISIQRYYKNLYSVLSEIKGVL